MESIISAHHIRKVFPGGLAALDGVNLDIAAGEIFVILGPSGSGKSTLLRIMSGLEAPSAGSVTLAPGLRRHDFSFVFQQFALLPWLDVAENIELGLFSGGMDRQRRQAVVGKELQQFGLEKFSRAHPRELSGGMRQRVGIARALATEPKVIFMDEPFSELDSFTAAALRQELLVIWQERRPTIVMVTHIIGEALELADRIAVLTKRPGRVEGLIANDLPRPRNRRSEQFYRLEDRLAELIKP